MVAQDQQFGAAVIVVEVEGHGRAAIGEDDDRARYTVVERLHGSEATAAPPAQQRPVRMLVEVLRRFGGMTPRALVGGRFVPGPGLETTFEVCVGGTLEGPHDGSLPATLLNRPLLPGLPNEFAGAVLEGLTRHLEDLECSDLPPGVFVIDRAGFDERESSTAVFRQTATLLRHLTAAALHDRDLDAEARAVMRLW